MKRTIILLLTTAALAACGSAAANDREIASLSTTPAGGSTVDSSNTADDPTGSTAPADPSEAPLQFAKCMREHGVDMPDPQVADGGGVLVQIGAGPGSESGTGPNPEDLDAANKACQHFLQDAAAGFDPPSPEDQKKMQEQALTFAKCMRDHGVDMPDPQFGDGGTFSISVGAGPDSSTPVGDVPAFDSKAFKDANEACGGPGGGGFAFSTGTVPG
jgi:hypothetical protein